MNPVEKKNDFDLTDTLEGAQIPGGLWTWPFRPAAPNLSVSPRAALYSPEEHGSCRHRADLRLCLEALLLARIFLVPDSKDWPKV